jgi:hypothetical protein
MHSPNVQITVENAAEEFDRAARQHPNHPRLGGTGIIITAGGPFLPSAYVSVRLLRSLGVGLPIEIWHAGEDEVPAWARDAFEPWDVTLHDVMPYCPNRTLEEMRGFPIKPAALMNSKLRHVIFMDADCFALRNPEFLFETPEYYKHGAAFWPDNRFHRMVDGEAIWSLTGLEYQGHTEFDTGIILLDKERCWRELCLVQWMNNHSDFWYRHVLGDKDTFYLSWRKLGATYYLAPPCRRYNAVVTRHYWSDGEQIADHRSGTSKYSVPRRFGPFRLHLARYELRSRRKDVYDEVMQRFLVRGFGQHSRYLAELSGIRDAFNRGKGSTRSDS